MSDVGRSTRTVQTRDRAALAEFFRRDPVLHAYELGDLDPFFWPDCTWHALQTPTGRLRAVVLEYGCPMLHTVLALGRDDEGAVAELFEDVLPILPRRFYAHLSPGLEARLGARRREAHGTYLKLALEDRAAVNAHDVDGVEALTPTNLEEVQAFYARAYPDNWFDPRMLETGRYFGIREGPQLVAVAGVHVYSPSTSVAALGNIATEPTYRGRGLARRATARLCKELMRDVDTIALNVRADNVPAIACYERLGFRSVATYEEWMVEAV